MTALLTPQTHTTAPPDDVVDLRAPNGIRAHCPLWWSTTPAHGGRRVGFIGTPDIQISNANDTTPIPEHDDAAATPERNGAAAIPEHNSPASILKHDDDAAAINERNGPSAIPERDDAAAIPKRNGAAAIRERDVVQAIFQRDDVVAALLERGCRRLREAGCELAVGPVEGDTWHRYRLVTWSDGTAPFALEPWSPAGAVVAWQRAGFTALETYASRRDDALGERDVRAAALAARFRAGGVTFRALDLTRFDDELAQIHALALRGFRDAPLYAPISFEAFAALYQPLVPHLDPRLCPVAECDGRIVGALFALRDPRAPETVVLKTIVRDGNRRFAGTGPVLTDRARAAAHALGARRAISALQHDGGGAQSLCPRAVVFRRYAVFAKELS